MYVLLNVPILHDMQVPQLHHFLFSLIDICELIELLQVKKKKKINYKIKLQQRHVTVQVQLNSCMKIVF